MLRLGAICLIVALLGTEAAFAGQPRPYIGRPVSEVLQGLQAAGLRIVFSSDLVPQRLRVLTEPTAHDPRQIAIHILVQSMADNARAPEIRGIRVTPNVFTTPAELDRFVAALTVVGREARR